MYREPIVMGRKLGLKGMDQKEERNIQSELRNKKHPIRMKKQFKKERRLRNLQDILKRSNVRIIGVPEREEEEQKIENLFDK